MNNITIELSDGTTVWWNIESDDLTDEIVQYIENKAGKGDIRA